MRALLLGALLLAGCAARPWQIGVASWYGPGFAGRPTASGDTFRPARHTAAHKELAFGSVVVVVRVDTGRRVRVVVNDRGPFVAGRVLDLSKGAARRLDMIQAGTAEVRWKVVGCRRGYDGPRGCGR
ncbi:MAG: septal ring lytic transglycosylase RlpA family protein [Alphaproteobacteria bacterium]|nr:septal ring lytic transglycosylase RlpA family protein [Alphaproteobacteria bacterium]